MDNMYDENLEEQEQSQEQQNQQENNSDNIQKDKAMDLHSIVEEEIKKKDKPIEEKKEAEAENQEELPKEKQRKTAKERIQELIRERKEMEADFRKQIDELRQELAYIQKARSEGEITSKQASDMKKSAEDKFKEFVDSIQVSEDLEPYKMDIVKTASIIAKQMIAQELQPIYQSMAEEYKMREEAELNRFRSEIMDYYSSKAKDYPELFQQGKTAPNGSPVLTPEMDELAMKIIAPYYLDNGYNPMISTKEGIDHLMQILSYAKNKTDMMKKQSQMNMALKKSKVETPSVAVSTVPKRLNIQDIVEEEMKRIGG